MSNRTGKSGDYTGAMGERRILLIDADPMSDEDRREGQGGCAAAQDNFGKAGGDGQEASGEPAEGASFIL